MNGTIRTCSNLGLLLLMGHDYNATVSVLADLQQSDSTDKSLSKKIQQRLIRQGFPFTLGKVLEVFEMRIQARKLVIKNKKNNGMLLLPEVAETSYLIYNCRRNLITEITGGYEQIYNSRAISCD